MIKEDIKNRLENEFRARNTQYELTYKKPDPLMVARRYKDETISLICALFAYGNATQIVKFLDSLDFGLLDESEAKIKKALSNHYYRFQISADVQAIFIALKRLRGIDSLENIFWDGYKKEENFLDGLWHLISSIKNIYNYKSKGYNFLVGSVPKTSSKCGTYKRYLMYIRWMVRKDKLDIGIWSRIPSSALLMPLDTHTFNVSCRLGLLKRKSYDMKAVLELTEALKKFDMEDPLKYDFALYRLGQENII